MRIPTMVLAALAAGACARASLVSQSDLQPGEDERQQTLAAEQRSSRLEQDLSGLFSAATPRDCGRACALVQEICDLSDRICSIADRHRDDLDLRTRCATGQERCERSRTAASSRCTCRRP